MKIRMLIGKIFCIKVGEKHKLRTIDLTLLCVLLARIVKPNSLLLKIS